MNESAPITWLISEINAIVSAGASSTAGAIAGIISPLAAAGFGIYIILMMVNYARGAESEPVWDFFLKMAAFSIVIGLGLNAGNYTSHILPIVTETGNDLAAAVSGSVPTSNSLDELARHYIKIIEEGSTAAAEEDGMLGISSTIMYYFKSAIVVIGLVPFLVAAAIIIVVANVGSTIVAMVGPIFFAALLFPATRQYFSAWLNTAISYALVPLFVAVVASASVEMSKKMLSVGAGGLNDTTLKMVILASIGNLALILLLNKVGQIASALSAGGVAVGGGSGIGSMARGIASSTGVNTFGSAMGRQMGRDAGKHMSALARQQRRNLARAFTPSNKIKAG